MKRMLLALALAGATLTAFAQGTTPTVTIAAKGDDVRSILSDMFKQSGKNFVINPGVRFVLYLSLDKVEFDEALAIVCRNANLRFEVQNGIYYISAGAAKVAELPKTEPPKEDKVVIKTSDKPAIKIEPTTKVPAPAIKKALSPTVLAKRITTRYSKTDLREVMAAFTKQTHVPIQVAADVPAYKLDAYLINTSLKYALDRITTAAKLEYRFTDTGAIQIVRVGAPEALASTTKKN